MVTLILEIAWAVSSLEGKLNFYVKQCEVQDMSRDPPSGINIIDESCYSEAAEAGPLGGALTNRLVKRVSQFQYRSFSYHKLGQNQQKLKCEIEFCVIDGSTR